MNRVIIRSYRFSDEGRKGISGKHAEDWPVVYLIYNDMEAYIGETCSFANRFSQHLANPARRELRDISVILDDEFNKSATLDLEQTLIRLFNADGKFSLQNLNAGQSVKHDYYQREMYMNKLPSIWEELMRMHLAAHELSELENSTLFKYSPYISLTQEQTDFCHIILHDILERLTAGEDGTAVINGSAGTGKTVMAINLIFQMVTASNPRFDLSRETVGFTDEQLETHEFSEFCRKKGGLRVGLVVPMASLRKTMEKVFRKTGNGLKSKMVMGPSDVVNDYLENGPFDVLLVDESHRLAKRKNLPNFGSFDDTCRSLNMEPAKATQLDWIVRCSRYRILFYDPEQTVKGSDISSDQFDEAVGGDRLDLTLTSQLRCAGGEEYLRYIDRIFKCRQAHREEVSDYDFRIFGDVDSMVKSIKALNDEMGLCRNVAGYSWPWSTRNIDSEDIRKNGLYDIEIEGNRYVWNMKNVEWIMREESIDEIGSIHTTQGYDLNYVGVIFGREIDYDERTNRIVVDLDQFYDRNVKAGEDPETVRQYIINAYKVMMTRGIRGCYVYACNESMRRYLRRFIPSAESLSE